MTEQTQKKRSFNAIDVTVVLLVVLLILGAVGRVLLDRRRSLGIEQRMVSFTCVLPASDSDMMLQGNTLYTASGNVLGSITDIDETVLVESSFGSKTEKYISVTGSLLVKGYEKKNGVFCTSDGEELRVNAHFTLQNGEDSEFYINNIVENGQ